MSEYHVTLYVSQDCEDCDKAKRLLRDKGISFEEKNIQDPGARGELKYKTGRAQCPSIDVDGRFFCGLGKIERAEKIITKHVHDISMS